MRRDWLATGAIVVSGAILAALYLTTAVRCDPPSGDGAQVCYGVAPWGMPALFTIMASGVGLMVFSIVRGDTSKIQRSPDRLKVGRIRPEGDFDATTADSLDRRLRKQSPDLPEISTASQPHSSVAGRDARQMQEDPQAWAEFLRREKRLLDAYERLAALEKQLRSELGALRTVRNRLLASRRPAPETPEIGSLASDSPEQVLLGMMDEFERSFT